MLTPQPSLGFGLSMSETDFIGRALQGRRSLESALADLAAKYLRHRSPELAQMIRELEAEIAHRKQAPLEATAAECGS
jgi:DNA-binding FadR family transcriptional regulator